MRKITVKTSNDIKKRKETPLTQDKESKTTTKKVEKSGLRMLEQEDKTGSAHSFLLGYN